VQGIGSDRPTVIVHDPEKLAPDLIGGGYRFSDKIMHQE